MSGGYFDYNQYKIGDIADKIQMQIDKNGAKKTEEELSDERWYQHNPAEYYKTHPEELYHTKYPNEIIEKFKEAVLQLRRAQIYAQRVDWFLSCDDGEVSFIERLKEDLDELDGIESPNEFIETNEEYNERIVRQADQ